MKRRCYKKGTKEYDSYGGRGIRICSEWYDEVTGKVNNDNFISWAMNNGWRPGQQIDRIDNDKGYSPENCRWVTQKKNVRNKSNNRILTYKGESRCISEWAEILGMPVVTLHSRIASGWTVDKSIETPVGEECESRIEFNGERKSIARWARDLGISYTALRHRIQRGEKPSEALTRKVGDGTFVPLTYHGKTQSIKDWSKELGLSYGTLVARVQVLKWSAERALSTPIRKLKIKRKI